MKTDVKAGHVWQDWDSRFSNQTPTYKQVMWVKDGYAFCESHTEGKAVRRRCRIRLDRFRPRSTGYRLVKGA